MTESGWNMANPSGADAALAVTLDWLGALDWTDDFGVSAIQPLDTSGSPGSLAERLAASGLDDWRDEIVTTAGPGQSIRLTSRLEWLMAQAALEVASNADHPGLFRATEKLKMLGGVSDAALAAAVCDRIADSGGDITLLQRLRMCLHTFWNSHFNDRLRRYVESTSLQPLASRSLWPPYRGLPLGDGWAHRVAATLRPGSYMEMLASFPVPLQHGFADPLSPIDLDLAATLVRASPEVFSEDGTPLGPVVVFALLDAIEMQLATIDVQSINEAEFGFGRILDSMFSRSDGNWIGRAWLQRIIWQDTPRQAGRVQANVSAQRSLRDWLLGELSSRITPYGEAVFDWVRQEVLAPIQI